MPGVVSCCPTARMQCMQSRCRHTPVGSDVTQVDYDGDQWRSLQSKRGLSDFLFITPPGMAIIGRLGIW